MKPGPRGRSRRDAATVRGETVLAFVVLLAVTVAVGLNTPLPAAETAAGSEAYVQCQGCHALSYHRTGPAHCGVVGRRAGTAPGYSYSDAMRASGIVWTPDALDRFLAAPTEVVPGTTMTYAGVASPEERQAIVDYLGMAERSDACQIGDIGDAVAPERGSNLRPPGDSPDPVSLGNLAKTDGGPRTHR